LPDAAKGTSEASAKAFVRHYVELVNYAMRTGDVGQLRALSAKGCRSCAAVASNVETVYADGGKLTGKGWRITALQPLANQASSAPVIQAGVRVNPQTKVAALDEEPEHFDGGKQLMTFYLKRVDTAWTVMQWSQSS
jgi:hypothetical protein